MVDISELTESVKGYIEGLQAVLQRKYQISEEKALNMITSSYIMDSLIDYPEETLHDDIEAHADNIYFTLEKTEKLTVLQTLQQKLGLKPSQIAIVEDTVKTLDYIRAHSDFVTVHVSSFME